MDNNSQFFSNCSDLTIKDLVIMNFALAACFLFSSLIVLLLIVCKAYKSVLQRTTTVRELFLAASIEHHFKYEGRETVCTWIAFIHNWFGILLFV